MRGEKVYILPCDGIAGEETELRETPLAGFFAVKFGKNHLERALGVQRTSGGGWAVYLDGFLVASPSFVWQKAFGKIYERAEKFGGLLLGRVLTLSEYIRLVRSRASDKERGIDLSGKVDLNTVGTPF